MRRRIAIIAAAVVVGWLVLLYALGFALGSRQERKTTERLAESLQATVTIEASDLALIRGRWTMKGLAVRHDDALGKLSLDVAGVRCELGPLGWALVDRSCGELVVSGVRMDVTSTALFKVKRPKRKPVRADRIVIDDAVIAFSPAAIAPTMGGIEIAIDHAESGPTLFRTPLSWLLTLEELRARVSLPAGVTVQLAYHHGVLTAAGGLFGATPVELPLELPRQGSAHDGHEEMQQLVGVGKDIAKRLVARRAIDWLHSKLQPGAPAVDATNAPADAAQDATGDDAGFDAGPDAGLGAGSDARDAR